MIAKKARIIKTIQHFNDEEMNFYTDDFLNDSIDNDEITAEEQGFMMGYMGDCYV